MPLALQRHLVSLGFPALSMRPIRAVVMPLPSSDRRQDRLTGSVSI